MEKSLLAATVASFAIGCAPESRGRGDSFGTGGLATVGDDDGDDDDDHDDDGGSSTGHEDDGDDADDDGTGEGPVGTGDVPAAGISIGLVEASQAVAVALGDGGTEIPPTFRNAELVAGRPVLVRAQWRLGPGEAPRPIEARLELEAPDGSVTTIVDEALVQGEADLSTADGGFTWVLDWDLVVPGIRYRIGLFEVDGVAREGSTQGATFPTSGHAELGVRGELMEMTVVLVPVITPDGETSLGPVELAEIEERLLATYPVEYVDLWVREPWVRDSRLETIDEAFSFLVEARWEDGEGPAPYYHLVLDNQTCCSGDDFADWAGIANIVLDGPNQPPHDGLSKLYPEDDDLAWDVATIVHEIGHNHGRLHAPCGDPAGPDPDYPYAGAGLGVRGWDPIDGTIIDPIAADPVLGMPYTDFMSYCWPQWWSDYSWQALVERVRRVTSEASVQPPSEWRLRGFARPNGVVTWSWTRMPGRAPITAGPASVVVHDEAGGSTELPVVVSQLGDSEIRVLEAAPPPRIRIAELELHDTDGTISRVSGDAIRR